MTDAPRQAREVAGVDREVVLNVRMREPLRHALRLRAFQERMALKDYLDKVLTQHIEQRPSTI